MSSFAQMSNLFKFKGAIDKICVWMQFLLLGVYIIIFNGNLGVDKYRIPISEGSTSQPKSRGCALHTQ